MRLFSIIQWHHFAYMIIGLALFGYGISGTLINYCQRWLISRFNIVYVALMFLFSLTSFICFYFAQSVPLNIEEIFWDYSQTGYLVFIFVSLTIPFLLAASAICLSLMHFNMHTGFIYSANLIGSGFGGIASITLLYIAHPQSALLIISISGLLTGLIAYIELSLNFKNKLASFLIASLAFLLLSSYIFDLKISPYKSLEQILQISGTKIIKTKSSALGYLHVIENLSVPLRHAPGLSLKATNEPPPQLGVFTDGDNMTVITQFPDSFNQLEYLDQTSSALPYHLIKPKNVLIAESGGGAGVLQALYHGSPKIDATEVNPQIVDLVNHEYREFSGGLYDRPNISVSHKKLRNFLTGTSKKFDLIQISSPDSFTATSVGLYALNEDYSYTTDALKLYINRLEPNGYVAITRWISLPPKETLRLLATAIEVLEANNVDQPSQQLVLIRSWQTSTLLIKNGLINNRDIGSILDFCHRRLFDVAYIPGIKREQANKYNILHTPIFYNAALALLSAHRAQFTDKYKFNISPASDNQPYFHNHFKWSAAKEIFSLRNRGGAPLIETGYIALLMVLAISTIISATLIITPILTLKPKRITIEGYANCIRFFAYFFVIGLSFLLLEIAFINKFILFLHHPIFSIATMITSFLLFAGLGSSYATYIAERIGKQKTLFTAATAIVLICLIYQSVIVDIFELCAGLPFVLKILTSTFLIAPLAFFLGMPFPLALAGVLIKDKTLVPWAWGINGCASVISTALATILAMHYGFSFVIVLAAILYLVAACSLPKPFLQ